jgi:hypothetical protein
MYPGDPQLTVENPDRLARILQRYGYCPEIGAPINVRLHLIVFSGWSEAAKAMLCGGLGSSILGVGLWIDGGAEFGGQLGTEIGDGTLDLAQESGDFIFLLGTSLVLWGLTRVILLLALLALLARLAMLILLTVAVSKWCLTLVLVILLR